MLQEQGSGGGGMSGYYTPIYFVHTVVTADAQTSDTRARYQKLFMQAMGQGFACGS